MRARGGRQEPAGSPDLRAVALATAAWAGALAGFLLPVWTTACVIGAGVIVLGWAHRRGRRVLTGVACLLAAAAVAVAAGVRAETNRSGPIADLAAAGAYVQVHARVTSDPVLREGKFAPYAMTRLTVTQVTGRGHSYHTHVPVLVLSDASWRRVRLDSTVSAGGRRAAADGSDLAAVLSTSRPPSQLA
ncbi:MAG: ComEC/Rec2 family competence protein, partial [Nocardioidaceae bacterium]